MTSQEHTRTTYCIVTERVESLDSSKYKNSTKYNNFNMRLDWRKALQNLKTY